MSAHRLIRYPFGGTSIVPFDAYGRSLLRRRRHLLRGFPPFSVVPLSVRRSTRILIHLYANERDAKIGAALDPHGERGPDLTPSP
jgi:hypothetical protein